MRVLVTGGRNFSDIELVKRTLGFMHEMTPINAIIHGAAPGADALAGWWARENAIQVEEYPARWREQGRAAGPIRNQEMITVGKPDVCVAFPGGTGTADMVRRARAAGVRVVEVPSVLSNGEGKEP
jgi:hypothetical protein